MIPVGEENNCDKDEDSDLELSDDSIPPLVYDSSDDFSDDDDDSLFSEDSDAYSLPALASCGESDTESESEDDFCCSSDDQVPPLHCMSGDLCCSGMCPTRLYSVINRLTEKRCSTAFI